MGRVSESSSFHAINHAVGKTKTRLEDLQIKGSNLKKVQKPSDDPIGNVELLGIRSQNVDAKQYLRNVSYAKAQLSFTENAIEELTELTSKAKEIAIGQSSSLFDVDIRRSVAKEVSQLRKQAIAISNRRMGNKYIFGGFKNLTKPFDGDGVYKGDNNQTKLEVSKDFFVPVNFSGSYVFLEKENTKFDDSSPLDNSPFQEMKPTKESDTNIPFELNQNRELASTNPAQNENQNDFARRSLFDELESLENALVTNNHEIIQDLLPRLDKSMDRLIEVRTKIGSVINSVENSENTIEKTKLLNSEYASNIEDADVAELFTDLNRQQNVLNATYKASSQMMGKSLMNFIR
jgi:flagellar hook-associated protein 3 FlgL